MDGRMRPIATASAPASIGNVGVGFDVLGLAFDAARDRVTAVREAAAGRPARRGERAGRQPCPTDGAQQHRAGRRAGVARRVSAPISACGWSIDKGVPMSAGMGGSAASAVAAAAAVNALLPEPLPVEALLPFAIEGERVSSDPPPWDNVVAALFGGLVLGAREEEPVLIRRLPVPAGVVVAPASIRRCEGRDARGARDPARPRCRCGSRSSIAANWPPSSPAARPATSLWSAPGFEDLLVEPQRAHLLPALRRREGGGARRRRARLLLLRLRAVGLRLGAASNRPTRSRRRWPPRSSGAGVGARAYRAPVDSAGVQPGRLSAGLGARHEVRQHPRERAGGVDRRGDPQRRRARWRPLSAGRTGPASIRTRCAVGSLAEFAARRCSRLSSRATRSPRQLPAICAEAFDFPAPLVMPDAGAAGPARARALPRPDRRVQGFRRALPDGLLRPARRDEARSPSWPRLRATPAARSAARPRGGAALRALILYPQGRVSAFQQHSALLLATRRSRRWRWMAISTIASGW